MRLLSSTFSARTDRNGKFFAGLAVLAGAAVLLLAPLSAHGAGSGPAVKSEAVKFEEIPGSKIKRVILTAKAAERLGIETGQVGEKPIVLRQVVGGRVTPRPKDEPKPKFAGAGPASSGFAGLAGFAQISTAPAAPPVAQSPQASSSGETGVQFTLSPGEWDRLEKSKPARVLPLATRNGSTKEILARPSGMTPGEDLKRSMLSVYYILPGKEHSLPLYQRVRVDLPLVGTDQRKKVAPYAAVYYDAKGEAWVYTNPKPLVFERQPIVVERVVGDLAVLSEGPPVGTSVVTTGAALLYGAEVVFKK